MAELLPAQPIQENEATGPFGGSVPQGSPDGGLDAGVSILESGVNALEAAFSMDLDGDGDIGLAGTVEEPEPEPFMWSAPVYKFGPDFWKPSVQSAMPAPSVNWGRDSQRLLGVRPLLDAPEYMHNRAIGYLPPVSDSPPPPQRHYLPEFMFAGALSASGVDRPISARSIERPSPRYAHGLVADAEQKTRTPFAARWWSRWWWDFDPDAPVLTASGVDLGVTVTALAGEAGRADGAVAAGVVAGDVHVAAESAEDAGTDLHHAHTSRPAASTPEEGLLESLVRWVMQLLQVETARTAVSPSGEARDGSIASTRQASIGPDAAPDAALPVPSELSQLHGEMSTHQPLVPGPTPTKQAARRQPSHWPSQPRFARLQEAHVRLQQQIAASRSMIDDGQAVPCRAPTESSAGASDAFAVAPHLGPLLPRYQTTTPSDRCDPAERTSHGRSRPVLCHNLAMYQMRALGATTGSGVGPSSERRTPEFHSLQSASQLPGRAAPVVPAPVPAPVPPASVPVPAPLPVPVPVAANGQHLRPTINPAPSSASVSAPLLPSGPSLLLQSELQSPTSHHTPTVPDELPLRTWPVPAMQESTRPATLPPPLRLPPWPTSQRRAPVRGTSSSKTRFGRPVRRAPVRIRLVDPNREEPPPYLAPPQPPPSKLGHVLLSAVVGIRDDVDDSAIEKVKADTVYALKAEEALEKVEALAHAERRDAVDGAAAWDLDELHL